MNFHKINSNSGPLRILTASFAFFIVVLGLSSNIWATEKQKTLFLPLKITSLSTNAKLTSETDIALSQALSLKEYTLLPRAEAEKLLDYQAEWPPAPSILSAIELFSKYDNLVIGSLTVLGKQLSIDFKVYDLLSLNSPKYYTAMGNSPAEIKTIFYSLVNEIFSYNERESIIASIAPAGNKKIDSGAILKNIQTKPGDTYNATTLREDLKAIFKMGHFDDIQIEVKQGAAGKEILFRIIEKPVISDIIFSGTDELDEDKVKEAIIIEKQSILNPAKVNKDSEAIQLLYKSKGYYNTTVSTQISYPTKESAEVRFVIDEGEKIYIKNIVFEGNSTFDDDELEDVIETDTKGWFSWITDSGLLDYDQLNQDAGRIITYYGDNGFLEAKIGDPEVTQEKEWLYITFIVEEGTRFKVGKVDITGDLLESEEKLIELLALKDEEYVSRKILRDDILKINDFFAERGYANADVRPRIKKAADENTLDITVNISKGELVYINRITIKGNTRTRDNVIRRELLVKEGGIFDSKAMRDSVQNLQYLSFFSEVSITPEDSFDESTMDLVVEVEDKSTGNFTIGAGYSSIDHLLLMGEIAENNFLGRGDTLSFSVSVGGESDKFSIKYKNPHLYDSDLSMSIDLFDMNREYDDYTKDSKGGALSFGYPVWEKWRGYGAYSYTDTTLSDIDDDASYIIRNSADIHVTSAAKFTLSRDSRNKRFGPTKGSRHSISARYAGGPIGGDAEFTKIEGSTSWYFPLFWNNVFHFKGVAGQVFENKDDALPVYERFYLGGLRSIRGFDYAKISPKDPVTDERIGGDKMWYTNWEFVFPLVADQGLNGVFFYDIGNVYNDDESWDFSSYKHAVGLGVRWFSPMGPLRLEWGYNLDPEDDEDSSVWDFSIGGIF